MGWWQLSAPVQGHVGSECARVCPLHGGTAAEIFGDLHAKFSIFKALHDNEIHQSSIRHAGIDSPADATYNCTGNVMLMCQK